LISSQPDDRGSRTDWRRRTRRHPRRGVVGVSRRAAAGGRDRLYVDAPRDAATGLRHDRRGMGSGLRPAGDLERLSGPWLLLELRASRLSRHPPRADLRGTCRDRKALAEPDRAARLLVGGPGRRGAGRLPIFPRRAPGRSSGIALACRRAVGTNPVLGCHPGGGTRFLPPREHGARIRPARGMGGDSGPPGRDVGPVRPHPDVQRGPGVHRWCHRDRDVGLRRARRQEALAIHPLPGGRVVPHRDRDRAAALSQRRLHRLCLLPVALRPRPQPSGLTAGCGASARPTRGAGNPGRDHRISPTC